MTELATLPPAERIGRIAERFVSALLPAEQPRIARSGYDEQHDCIWVRLERDQGPFSGGLLRFARRDFEHEQERGGLPRDVRWPGDEVPA